MAFWVTLSMVLLMVPNVTASQTNAGTNCRSSPELCEVTVGGQVLTFGMPKDRVLGLLSNSYKIIEDSEWSAAHKPTSIWHLTNKESVIKGGVKFKGEKLDGAMVVWSPDSSDSGDFAANLFNLLAFLQRRVHQLCPDNGTQHNSRTRAKNGYIPMRLAFSCC